jgi:beta-lactamase class A
LTKTSPRLRAIGDTDRMRLSRSAVVPLVVALVSGGGLAAAPSAHATTTCTKNPFTASFVSTLRAQHPNQRFTAAVYETRTRCWYHLNRDLTISTASVIKAEIMGATLLKAQRAGRRVTEWEHARIRPMIRYSHNNPPTGDLYGHVGGTTGMEAFDQLVGATQTTHSATYGATMTTAEDRTRIALAMLWGGGPLAATARSRAWAYMNDVHPTQRWGITAGVPAGWQIALKNGFYPSRGWGWRLGSTGFVRRTGTNDGYAISILTDGSSGHYPGMQLVEKISRRVAEVLAGTPAAARVVTRSVCTRTTAGESWTTVARRVGLTSSDASAVRVVSGGNPTPLQGQRGCSPWVRKT